MASKIFRSSKPDPFKLGLLQMSNAGLITLKYAISPLSCLTFQVRSTTVAWKVNMSVPDTATATTPTSTRRRSLLKTKLLAGKPKPPLVAVQCLRLDFSDDAFLLFSGEHLDAWLSDVKDVIAKARRQVSSSEIGSVEVQHPSGRPSDTTNALAALLASKDNLTEAELIEVKRLMQRKSRASSKATELKLISIDEAVKRQYQESSDRSLKDDARQQVSLNFIDTPLGSVQDTKQTLQEHLFLERQSSGGMESALASACEAQLDSLVLSTDISLPSSRLTNASTITTAFGSDPEEDLEERLGVLMSKKILDDDEADEVKNIIRKMGLGGGLTVAGEETVTVKELKLVPISQAMSMATLQRKKNAAKSKRVRPSQPGIAELEGEGRYGEEVVEMSLEAMLDERIMSTHISRPQSTRSAGGSAKSVTG